MDYHNRIVRDPAICGGQPVIRARVLVRVILGFLAHGEPVEVILREFPTLKEDDVRLPEDESPTAAAVECLAS